MYAIVKTGGKQLKVAAGDKINVEKLPTEEGKKVKLDEVLLVFDGKETHVGTPVLADAVVEAKVLEQTRGDKIVVFKKKRRQNYRRKNGHRQLLTTLEITGINFGKAKPAAKKAEAKAEEKTEE